MGWHDAGVPQAPAAMAKRCAALLLLLGTIGGYLTVRAGSTEAHWAGFEFERHFCETTLGFTCTYTVSHTWGFVSNKHQDSTGNPTIAAYARDINSWSIIFSEVGTGTVRACFEGDYPNCHDQDSYWLYPEIANYGPGNHAFRGHGWY